MDTGTCAVDGCTRPAKTRGVCQTHYMRRWYSGELGEGAIRPYRSDPEMLFWRMVDKGGPNECWEWTGARSVKGYGKWKSRGKWTSPHRFSYELHNGPIPVGLTIDHLCLNKACVNPAHLEAVTNLVNRQRAAALQTHCKRGHEFTPENTKRHSVSGARVCIACEKERGRAHYERTKRKR